MGPLEIEWMCGPCAKVCHATERRIRKSWKSSFSKKKLPAIFQYCSLCPRIPSLLLSFGQSQIGPALGNPLFAHLIFRTHYTCPDGRLCTKENVRTQYSERTESRCTEYHGNVFHRKTSALCGEFRHFAGNIIVPTIMVV